MPIKPVLLQRRLTEVGRIRIGQTVPTKSGKTRPAKLDRFRFTSSDRQLLESVARLYGGNVIDWQPHGGGAKAHEVVTDVASVPVIVPPQSITQHMELWAAGGCQRRCDGETEFISGEPCLCIAQENMVCRPTTRLSVMLRDVESIGVWRLESKGWNAAAELPGMAELLAQAGGYVLARLWLKPMRQVKGGETRDFMVPALAVDALTPAQLLTTRTAPAPQVAQPAHKPLELPSDEHDHLDGADTLDELRERYKLCLGHMTDELQERFTSRAEALQAVAGMNRDTLWMSILEAAPQDWAVDDVVRAFAAQHDGITPDSATTEQLAMFLHQLRGAS